MYRTALFAENRANNTSSSIEMSRCNDLVNNFNKGDHITDDNNNANSYSIL